MSRHRHGPYEPNAKFSSATIKRLFRDAKASAPFFIVAALLILIYVAMTVYAPTPLGDLSQTLAVGMSNPDGLDLNAIGSLTVRLGVLYVMIATFSYLASILITTGVQRYCKKLRTYIAAKINRMPLSYFDSHATGDIMSRVTNDVDSVSQNFDQSISMLLGSTFTLVGSVIMMFVTSWIMALVCFATIPLAIIIMMGNMKLAQPAFRKRQHQVGVVNGVVEEHYGGQQISLLFNAQKRKGAEFYKENEKLSAYMFRAQIFGGMMMPIMNLLSYFSLVLVILVGGLLLADGKFGINYGVIASFLVYIRLFQQPFTQIGQALNSVQTISAAAGRVYEFLGEEELADERKVQRKLVGPSGLEEVKGEIVFDHVRFSYDASRVIIPDFSAHVKPGMKVAIVGPTGAGKTTMVNLLERFYEIESGSITIDGVNIKDMPREEIHDIFSMVLQDSWIFNGTLRENLVYNSKWVKEERILQALEDANLNHYVSSLPNGLDYVVSDASDISSGQRQLLTIARAMIRNAPLLILDEATSNVDTRTEIMIQEAMDRLSKGRTSFVIAHRLSTIRNADLILVMDGGNIIEQGTHEELLKANGFYAGLYQSQFALE